MGRPPNATQRSLAPAPQRLVLRTAVVALLTAGLMLHSGDLSSGHLPIVGHSLAGQSDCATAEATDGLDGHVVQGLWFLVSCVGWCIGACHP